MLYPFPTKLPLSTDGISLFPYSIANAFNHNISDYRSKRELFGAVEWEEPREYSFSHTGGNTEINGLLANAMRRNLAEFTGENIATWRRGSRSKSAWCWSSP